jgi:CRISPR-associated protein Csm4
MNTYQITIQPRSLFGTPLKGDTLFGQFCWQCATDPALLNKPFDDAIATYLAEPFVLFSSAFPLLTDDGYALKRPDAPLDHLFDFSGKSKEDILDSRKKLEGKKWLICRQPDGLRELRKCSFINDDELAALSGLKDGLKVLTQAELSHNSINRLTGTTTGEGFAPFTQDSLVYAPASRLVIFVAIDEQIISADALKTGLERIGSFGFGRDASTGMGRFDLLDCQPVDLKRLGPDNANALYTLAPSVPDAALYRDALFTPFTRFGRHGDRLAVSGRPFKNPVIMADEGALLFPHDMSSALAKPYLGTAVCGVSKIKEINTVHQGYSLHIPVRLEVV